MTLSKNEYAERAALALVFQSSDDNKLWQLDEADFGDPINRYLFRELNALVASGAPLGDATACATWFTSPAAKERAKELGEHNLPLLAADAFGEKAIAANWDYYLGLIRGERLRRALQGLDSKLNEKLADGESETALTWLCNQVEALQDEYQQATA